MKSASKATDTPSCKGRSRDLLMRCLPQPSLLTTSLQLTFKVWSKQGFPKSGDAASVVQNQLHRLSLQLYPGTFHV